MYSRTVVLRWPASARQRPHGTGVVAGVDALQGNTWNLWTLLERRAAMLERRRKMHRGAGQSRGPHVYLISCCEKKVLTTNLKTHSGEKHICYQQLWEKRHHQITFNTKKLLRSVKPLKWAQALRCIDDPFHIWCPVSCFIYNSRLI